MRKAQDQCAAQVPDIATQKDIMRLTSHLGRITFAVSTLLRRVLTACSLTAHAREYYHTWGFTDMWEESRSCRFMSTAALTVIINLS